LARHFSDDFWPAREQRIQRFDDLDPAQLFTCRFASAGSRQRTDDLHGLVRAA